MSNTTSAFSDDDEVEDGGDDDGDDDGDPFQFLFFTFPQGFLWVPFQGHKRTLEEKENRKGEFPSFLSNWRKDHC